MNNNVSLEKIVAMHCTWWTMRFVFRKKTEFVYEVFQNKNKVRQKQQ